MDKPDVLSFLKNIERDDSLKSAEEAFRNNPDIKLRKLQETKKSGKEQCLYYILTTLCKNSVPDMGDIMPVRPNVLPDLDNVVGKFIDAKTDGKGATFYVHEALKKNPNHCMKRVVESVDALIKNRYFEKELDPKSIEDEDYEFTITPEIEDKLKKVIQDNNMDDLADVIKTNVRTDAIDEVSAAKKEKEERMKLEEELMSDDSITSESAIEEALKSRSFSDVKVYQPSLLKGILINSFNNAENVGGTKKDCVSDSHPGFTRSSILSIVPEDLFNDVEGGKDSAIKQCNLILVDYIAAECKDAIDRYLSSVNPVDLESVPNKLSSALNNGCINTDQMVSILDLRQYHSDIKEFGDAIREYLKNGGEVPECPSLKTTEVSIASIPTVFEETMRSMNSVCSVVKDVETYTLTSTKHAEKICASRSDDVSGIDAVITVYDSVLKIALGNLEWFQACMDNIIQMVSYTGEAIECAKSISPQTKAFSEAVAEYTVWNVVKALKLESMSLQDINNLATEYATNK